MIHLTYQYDIPILGAQGYDTIITPAQSPINKHIHIEPFKPETKLCNQSLFSSGVYMKLLSYT